MSSSSPTQARARRGAAVAGAAAAGLAVWIVAVPVPAWLMTSSWFLLVFGYPHALAAARPRSSAARPRPVATRTWPVDLRRFRQARGLRTLAG